MKISLLFIGIFAASVVIVAAQAGALVPPHAVLATDKDTVIAARVDKFLTAAGASGAVLIAKDGRVLLRKGYGLANEEIKLPFSTRTVFDIGSVTKQFTGAAILKLEEEGKLKVSDPIAKFFQNVPVDKQMITVHQLLTHTAGFDHDVVDRSETLPKGEVVRRTLAEKLISEPGRKYIYSNAGYALLAAIIEAVSGTSYETYLKKKLWEPSGMFSTGHFIRGVALDHIARGYDISGDVGLGQEKWWGRDGPSWAVRGSGYVQSTVEDLYRWHLALNGEKILSNASKEKYFAPHVPEGESGTSHYGYGWSLFNSSRNTRVINHNGSNTLVYTDFYRFVDEGVVVIFFTNQPRTVSIKALMAVPKLFFNPDFPDFPEGKIALSKDELQRYAGEYELPTGDKITLDVQENDLVAPTFTSGAGRALTTFPKITDEGLDDLPARTAQIMIGLATDSLESLRDSLDIADGFDEEKRYWKGTFDDWRPRFGGFRRSEVIGSVRQKEYLVTYVLLQFERGNTVVQFRQNGKKQFYVGTSTMILPRHYRLIPQSRTEFAVYNLALRTQTQISFTHDAKDKIAGFTVQNGEGTVLFLPRR